MAKQLLPCLVLVETQPLRIVRATSGGANNICCFQFRNTYIFKHVLVLFHYTYNTHLNKYKPKLLNKNIRYYIFEGLISRSEEIDSSCIAPSVTWVHSTKNNFRLNVIIPELGKQKILPFNPC